MLKKIIVLYIVCISISLSYMQYFSAVLSAEDRTSAISPSSVYIYNNEGTSDSRCKVVYVLDLYFANTIVRVYDQYTNQILGQTARPVLGFIACVPVQSLSKNGGYVHVTVQEPGKGESDKTLVPYSQVVNPRIKFEIFELDTSKDISNLQFRLTPPLTSQYTIKKDKYYQVNIQLIQFPTVGTITLPIKYDPSFLQLMKLRNSGIPVKYYVDTMPASAPNGKNFDFSTTDYLNFGIMAGDNFPQWSGAAFSMNVDGGEYQYVNTETGMIKITCSTDTPGPIGDWTNTSNSGRVLRLFFKATQDGVGATKDFLRFATINDCPAQYLNDYINERKYYDIANPGGASVTILTANVLAPIFSGKVADEFIEEEAPLKLSIEQINTLPISMLDALNSMPAIPNTVKVYNYTNYTPSGNPLGTLDASLEDVLVVTPSDEPGAVRIGDIINVYNYNSSLGYVKIGSNEVITNDLPTNVYLKFNNLSPSGGEVYMSYTRSGLESEKIVVDYSKEDTRDVYFKFYRTESDIDYGENGQPLPSDMKIKKGERIQLRIYFNNFIELMSYTFPIHFNPNVVKVADSSFNIASDGIVNQKDYLSGISPFSTGKDLRQITLNEMIIYYAEESEIEDIMEQFGIPDRTAFYRIKSDVEIKLRAGVTEGDDIFWKGGLLFTDERVDDSGYPYVDNANGLLKITSAALTKPLVALEREGGYHFISINFIGYSDGNADFRFADEYSDGFTGAFDRASPYGGGVIVTGPIENMVGITPHWEVYSVDNLYDNPIIELSKGNALDSDVENRYVLSSNDVFVYNGYAFRDPGFNVIGADGLEGNPQYMKRYFYDDGTKIYLPDWNTGEKITNFIVRNDYLGRSKYSDHYTIYYTYLDPAFPDNQAVATREVYVIFKLGNITRTGTISALDSDAALDHIREAKPLDLSDVLYRVKTCEVTGNSVSAIDVDAIDAHVLEKKLIAQQYNVDEVNKIMLI